MLAETNSPKDMVHRSASFMINLPTTAPYMTCLTMVNHLPETALPALKA